MTFKDRFQRLVPARIEPLLSGGQFWQFISVGVLGAIADTTVLTLTAFLFGLADVPAKLMGAEVAILVMFVLNERWTFTGHGTRGYRPFVRRLGKSHLVRTGGVAVQLTVFWALLNPYRRQLAIAGIDGWLVVASLLSIGVATLVNYIFEGLFTWQVGSVKAQRGGTGDSGQ